MFDRGDWPSKWAEGIITPVHKKASINVPDNYRKITVMPVLGKVFEFILNSRLTFRIYHSALTIHTNLALRRDQEQLTTYLYYNH